MPRMNKKQGFACFGAIQKNERWSWSAITPKKDKVIITIWDHVLMGPNENYYDTRELIDIPPTEWQNHLGNNERIELLRYAQERLDGILYVLLCKAKDENQHPLEIREVYPWKANNKYNRVKLKFLDQTVGHYRVEYLDAVALRK